MKEAVREGGALGWILTLIAHTQQGLQYLVCVSICRSASTDSHTTGTKLAHAWVIPMALVQQMLKN